MSSVDLRDVHKTFDRHGRQVEALRGINLSIAPRQFTAVLGPSGCGKSTLLNMVAGFDTPTRGEVLVGGKPITAPGPQRAVVFQEAALFPWLNVYDNVVFGPVTQAQPSSEYAERAHEILAQVGLAAFKQHYPAELSGGMKQRVSLARVLIMRPQVMLMDEPFGSLDAQTRSLMHELLLQVWEREQQTVMFITHDIEEALLLADRVAVMSARPGHIKRELAVTLPRPRGFESTTSAEFNELKRELRELIHAESVRAETVIERE